MTAEQLISYQDELEIATFGLPLSQLHFNLLLRQEQLKDSLVERVIKDRSEVDYSLQSLTYRNNPWFFSKNYTIEPLQDDQDFYFLIETKVGQGSQMREILNTETQKFAQQKSFDLFQEEFKYQSKQQKSSSKKTPFQREQINQQPSIIGQKQQTSFNDQNSVFRRKDYKK